MATYPNTTSASDIWSLRDVYKAEAGGEWPSTLYYVDATYGTLVAAWEGHWGSASYTEGYPELTSSNVVLSDSDFQSVRASASSGLVYYVWGSSQENFVSFNLSDIENANVKPAPTTTINPDNFPTGTGATPIVHWWDEIDGASLSGSDYSIVGYRATNNFLIFNLSTLKEHSANVSLKVDDTISKVWCFYK